MGNAKFLDIRTKVQILLMYSHNCYLYIVCSYVLLSCFYLFDNMSTSLSRDSAIREPWRRCTEIRESRALCREQRVSVSCLLCAMVPGRKAALAASGEGECKFGACPACRFDIILLSVGTCRIEKKRASTASPDFIFKKVFGR